MRALTFGLISLPLFGVPAVAYGVLELVRPNVLSKRRLYGVGAILLGSVGFLVSGWWWLGWERMRTAEPSIFAIGALRIRHRASAAPGGMLVRWPGRGRPPVAPHTGRTLEIAPDRLYTLPPHERHRIQAPHPSPASRR